MVVAAVALVAPAPAGGTADHAAPGVSKPAGFDVEIYMMVDAPEEQIVAMHDFLEASSAVRHFVFLDKDAQLRNFKHVFRNDPDLVNNITAGRVTDVVPGHAAPVLRRTRVRRVDTRDGGRRLDRAAAPLPKGPPPGDRGRHTRVCRAGRRTQ